jgi:Mce-associated membrane protein
MIRLKSRHGGDQRGVGSAPETPAEPVQTAIIDDDTAEDAAIEDETAADVTAEADAEVSETSTERYASDDDEPPAPGRRSIRWSRLISYGLLPGLALLLASAAGFLKWQDISLRDASVARAESVRAATDSTIALLSYRPDTVQKDLEAARGRLTGTFLDAYTKLTHDVVIPGAKQKQISAVATVPGAASKSASANHAVVLVFVNQTVIVGQDAPTNSASSVRVTLDKIGGRWLISGFDPV